MFLFKKSLIGAYCNRLYDLEERALFHAMAELKQPTQAKILMSQILIQKAKLPNRQVDLSLNSSFR